MKVRHYYKSEEKFVLLRRYKEYFEWPKVDQIPLNTRPKTNVHTTSRRRPGRMYVQFTQCVLGDVTGSTAILINFIPSPQQNLVQNYFTPHCNVSYNASGFFNDQYSPSYRNQSINLHCKSIDCFLHDGEHSSLMD